VTLVLKYRVKIYIIFYKSYKRCGKLQTLSHEGHFCWSKKRASKTALVWTRRLLYPDQNRSDRPLLLQVGQTIDERFIKIDLVESKIGISILQGNQYLKGQLQLLKIPDLAQLALLFPDLQL